MSRFRLEYRELTVDEIHLMKTVKRFAAQMEIEIDKVPDPRYRALALTSLEESVMWATKGITG